LTAFREQDLQTRFLRLDALKETKETRRVVFLGLRRHDALYLLSRLAHDAAFSASLRTEDGREPGEREWIFCGSTPPGLPHARVAAPDTLGLDALVAPGDALCGEDIDWEGLFAEWLPVVHLDIARVDSGLSDLARAPYARALPKAWVAASGQGALFNGRLADLLTDVPDRVDLFSLRRERGGRAEWFVYENYDSRYTDFMAWSRVLNREPEAGSEKPGGNFGRRTDEFLRQWAGNGCDFSFPFTEPRLRLTLESARRKKALF
jgi:hypothetical protein